METNEHNTEILARYNCLSDDIDVAITALGSLSDLFSSSDDVSSVNFEGVCYLIDSQIKSLKASIEEINDIVSPLINGVFYEEQCKALSRQLVARIDALPMEKREKIASALVGESIAEQERFVKFAETMVSRDMHNQGPDANDAPA